MVPVCKNPTILGQAVLNRYRHRFGIGDWALVLLGAQVRRRSPEVEAAAAGGLNNSRGSLVQGVLSPTLKTARLVGYRGGLALC